MTTYIIPTVLYIKQHSITKLKYFGKTTKDPLKYNGSGKHWIRHIKKHGKGYVITTWVSEPYIDSIALSEFALSFSRDNNIVESKDWANLILENGLDGSPVGPTGPRGKQQNPSNTPPWNKGLPSEGKGISRGKQRNPAPEVECPYCGLVSRGGGNMKRWHFDNCKMKPL
jgi:hypothetical protein